MKLNRAAIIYALAGLGGFTAPESCEWFKERDGVWMRGCSLASKYYGGTPPEKCNRCGLPVKVEVKP